MIDTNARCRIESFARGCVEHGDMTPLCERQLRTLLEMEHDQYNRDITAAWQRGYNEGIRGD